MKAIVVWCLGLAAVVLTCGNSSAATWMTDYDTAVAKARNERKPLLINFTGSDWCGWCMKLKAEVFDKSEFSTFAEDNLVLLELDFPQRKAMPARQRKANQELMKKYGVKGFPTIVIADDTGKTEGELGYRPGGPRPFIDDIKSVRGYEWKDASVTAKPADEPAPSPVAKDEPLWGGLVTPPKQYDGLKLTGLSGSSNRRLAIINNQTFAPGETAKVKLKDGQVKVLCKEIRAKSVTIQLEGSAETKELFLAQ